MALMGKCTERNETHEKLMLNDEWHVNVGEKMKKSNLLYKVHQLPEFKCLSSRLAVVFAQSLEAWC